MRARPASVLAVAILCAGLVVGSPAQAGRGQANPAPSIAARPLIARAELLSRGFSAGERVHALMGCAAADAVEDRTEAVDWFLEAFHLAKLQLPPSHNRAADEEGVVMMLSGVDLPEALRLFSQQDLPSDWEKPDELSEDLRASASVPVFHALIAAKGLQSVPMIESMAQSLGGSGQYPYDAISQAVGILGAKDVSAAQLLLGQAIAFGAHDPGYSSTPRAYIRLLQQSQAYATPPLMVEGLSTALRLIQWDREHRPTEVAMQVKTPHGAAQFHSMDDYLVFALLPLLQKYDPERVESIRQQNPFLATLPSITADTPLHPFAAILSDPAQSGAGMEFAREQAITRLPLTDGEGIRALANQMATPYGHALGLTMAAQANGQDRNQAAIWLDQAAKELDTLPDDQVRRRLQLAAQLVTAYSSLHRPDKAQAIAEDAIRRGAHAYDEDLRAHPDRPSYQLAGVQGMASLVTSIFQKMAAPNWLIDQIENLRETELQVRLLLAAVTGLQLQARQS